MDTPDLIESLVSRARPVRPLQRPLVRTAGWLALMVCVRISLRNFANQPIW